MRNNIFNLFILIFFINNVFAQETCPPSIMITKKHYKIPTGWHVTREVMKEDNEKLIFQISVWNFDHKVGSDDDRITCIYKNGMTDSNIDITTDKKNFKKPPILPWVKLDDTSEYCFPARPVNPEDCPWS